jgi:signal transduction histidine kinase
MTVVCLQAGAPQRADGDAAATLHTIATTAAASLAELRDGLDEIETSAQPLDRSRLAAVGRRVGVDVVVTDTPGPAPVGPGAVLAFRIVREAVVNAARHAPGATVEVRIRSIDRHLVVEVLDSGAVGEPMAIGSGTGLSGLAEAVASVGGTMRWARREDGFEVVAEIPESATAAVEEHVEVAR